jgi:hypothetical protein
LTPFRMSAEARLAPQGRADRIEKKSTQPEKSVI